MWQQRQGILEKHAFPSTSTAAARRAPPQQREPASHGGEKAEPFAVGTAGHLIASTRSPLIYPTCTQVQTQRSPCFDAPAQGSGADVPRALCSQHREVINTTRPTGREASCLWLRMKAPFRFGQRQLDPAHVPCNRPGLSVLSSLDAAEPDLYFSSDSGSSSPVTERRLPY